MQKIRCPHCGVVNLEQFITFPQCAGCGRTLPSVPAAPIPFWRRKVGVFVWASIFGGSLVVLVAAIGLLQTPRETDARLITYGSGSRKAIVGKTMILGFTIDTLDETRAQRRSDLDNVKLRFPQRLFDDLALVSISPRPDKIERTAGGRYFIYDSLKRETAFQVRLLPLKPGNFRAQITLYKDGYLPGQFRFMIRALAVSSKVATPKI